MTHVVDFEKTAFSTSFRGVLPPSGPQIIAESGMGYPLPGTRETWVVSTVPWPLFSRLTPHASRSTTPDQRGQVVRKPFPAGYCLTPTAELAKTERGPISTIGLSLFSMSPNRAILTEKPNPFFLARRRPTLDHSLAAGGAQRELAPRLGLLVPTASST